MPYGFYQRRPQQQNAGNQGKELEQFMIQNDAAAKKYQSAYDTTAKAGGNLRPKQTTDEPTREQTTMGDNPYGGMQQAPQPQMQDQNELDRLRNGGARYSFYQQRGGGSGYA